jgi:putative oxidoreductase
VIGRLVALVLAPASPRASVAATVVRVGAGAILIGFGQSKFVHHAKETRAFGRYGLPAPEVFTYAIGTVELVGGILLVAGLVTRLVALGLAGNMIGAIATGGRVDGGFVNLGLAPLLLVAHALPRLGRRGTAVDGRALGRRIGVRSPVDESSRFRHASAPDT